MKTIMYREAVFEAIAEEMQRDSTVVYQGTHVGLTDEPSRKNLTQLFGQDRVINMPITEYLMACGSIGMALAGLRPIAEIQFADFSSLCFDPMMNYASKARFWSHGKVSVPMVLLSHMGISGSMGNTHSQSMESWFANMAGLKIVMPSTPADAKGILKTAIRDNDPVIFYAVSGRAAYVKGEIPEEEYTIPLGQARIAREGSDVTLVAWHRALDVALATAEELQAEGISLEVIDPRTLVPFDMRTVTDSIRKTGRFIVAHDAMVKFGPGAEIVSSVMEEAYDLLKYRPLRVCTPMYHLPSNETETEVAVTKKDIRDAVYQCLGK